MAKTTTAVKDKPQTAKKAGEARRPAAKPAASGRKAAPAADDEELNDLAALAAATKELEDEERSKTESGNLVQGTISILMEGDPRYIPEARLNDYVVAQKKLVLGQMLDATVLGVFKLLRAK
jgi:hypothetical protein